MNVVVIGASDKPHKHSYMAVERLKNAGHNVYPLHKVVKSIHCIPVYEKLTDIKDQIHTITLYVNKEVSENIDLKEKAEKKGIDVVFGCTLVMLTIGSF